MPPVITDDVKHELIVRAVRELAPGATWSISGFEIADIKWDDQNIPQPDNNAIKAKLKEYRKTFTDAFDAIDKS